jgi:hypothetical protein
MGPSGLFQTRPLLDKKGPGASARVPVGTPFGRARATADLSYWRTVPGLIRVRLLLCGRPTRWVRPQVVQPVGSDRSRQAIGTAAAYLWRRRTYGGGVPMAAARRPPPAARRPPPPNGPGHSEL